jgi:hypothetical protein
LNHRLLALDHIEQGVRVVGAAISHVMATAPTTLTRVPRADAILILSKAAASLPSNLVKFPVERITPELRLPRFPGRLLAFKRVTKLPLAG